MWTEEIFNFAVGAIRGMPPIEQQRFQKCIDAYVSHCSKNIEKERYYEGKIRLSEVNLGIALPHGMRGLEVGCSWGAKAVDVLAARSIFDGFVGSQGADIPGLNEIVENNALLSEYAKACRDELKFGCVFATLSKDRRTGCKIRFHSPLSAAAIWDGERGGILCGFVIADSKNGTPTVINYYTEDAVYILRNNSSVWNAEYLPHRMGAPLLVPMIWNATSAKPFGRSRIKEPVRRLIQGYVRTIADAAIGIEFSTAPQKYLLGVTDDQYDAVVNSKFKQYVGSIIAATTNPETGEKPTFGQLQQGTIAPHVEMIRVLATQFAASTGLSVTDTGVVNDANPTSSDAIEAQMKTLIGLAEDLNNNNSLALRNIALMALAISENTTIDELSDEQRDIVAHFRNPSMPSIASTTDAAIKLASARPGFANTDVFLEMVGFTPADIRRIKAQEQRARGLTMFEELNNAGIG